MSFADSYLQKHAFRGPLIDTPPQDDLHIVVVIPAYKEPSLFKVLGSLFLCDSPGVGIEVIVLVNAPEDADRNIFKTNKFSLEIAEDWRAAHQRDDMTFHLLLDHSFPAKHAGVGLARKILMDEAARRLSLANDPDGIILSLDADTRVDEDYLTAVHSHLADPKRDGCSIYFEHPLEGDEMDWEAGDIDSGDVWKGETWEQVDRFSPETYTAIANYELHLRYYIHAIRMTSYPYAYQTVGSAFGVKAKVYCDQGGMNKRQAGEDFYFIQKVAQLGRWSDCSSTTVHPSPRPSDRVVFGTGPDIRRQLEDPGALYLSYDLELFFMLTAFYVKVDCLFKTDSEEFFFSHIDPFLKAYLLQNDFGSIVGEIRSNAATMENFEKRFLKRFNMLWILKFLHWAEENGYPKTDLIGSAFPYLLTSFIIPERKDARSLLKEYRKLDRKGGV